MVNCRIGLLLVAMGLAHAQGVVKPLSDVKFQPDEDVKCLSSAVETGDPSKGPSTIVLRAPQGCLIPWHYHTAEEQLIVIQGKVPTEMEGMPKQVLESGGFAMMPGKMKHRFSCQSKVGCILFVTFDRAYDIFWVK
ncbi:MAG TPA: cupin domain-containing protein [Bryobacteraceae bacterium]|jgi:quercetin dioxygenase-like cupin family protein|nr:cupin domain-containing protein [Bryobacteraceae bacterium]